MLPAQRFVGFLLLLGVACGGGSVPSGSSGTTGAPTTAQTGPAPTGPPAAATDVPDVTVRDVGTGADVNLRTLALADRPTLYWFWAPHWPFCAREAPGLEQFARDHAEEINVVGLGTQDSFAEAQAFVSRHRITFPMLWDRGFRSWEAFGIQGQPASILLSRAGQEVKRWIGALDEEERADVIERARL